eukprot:795714-Pleurochrysis_carterae.AAC.1
MMNARCLDPRYDATWINARAASSCGGCYSKKAYCRQRLSAGWCGRTARCSRRWAAARRRGSSH